MDLSAHLETRSVEIMPNLEPVCSAKQHADH